MKKIETLDQQAKSGHLTKQEYLDQQPTSPQIWLTQQLLTGSSKTELANIQRGIKRIFQMGYTSAAKTLPMNEVHEAVNTALKILQDENVAS